MNRPAHDKPSARGPAILIGLILLFSLWAMSYRFACHGDGCIGVVIPVVLGLLALIAQLLLFIPQYCWKRRWAQLSWAGAAITWMASSIAAYFVPLSVAGLL